MTASQILGRKQQPRTADQRRAEGIKEQPKAAGGRRRRKVVRKYRSRDGKMSYYRSCCYDETSYYYFRRTSHCHAVLLFLRSSTSSFGCTIFAFRMLLGRERAALSKSVADCCQSSNSEGTSSYFE